MTFADYIAAHLSERFEFGRLDCVLFCIGWLNHKRGKDYLADLPKWTSQSEARRVIKQVGGLEAALDAQLTRVHPNLAKDGDIALIDSETMMLFSGPHIVGPSKDGLLFTERTKATCAWSS